MKTVYIASPYTLGDVAVNVRRQIDAASDLLACGLIPFTPLLSHFIHLVHPHSYDEWLEYDLQWLSRCDCMLRLSGESKGADIEEAYAQKLGIPVYYSIEEFTKVVR